MIGLCKANSIVGPLKAALCIRRTRTRTRTADAEAEADADACNVARVSFNVAHVSCNVARVSCNITGNTCNITGSTCNITRNTSNFTRNTCNITRVRIRIRHPRPPSASAEYTKPSRLFWQSVLVIVYCFLCSILFYVFWATKMLSCS